MSVTVSEAKSARSVYHLNGEVPRNPASITKLVTARAALGILGPTHVFTTAIHGAIVDGHASRLVIRSDGDPTISTNDLRGYAAELLRLGLTTVDEGVFVGQGAFEERFVPPAFEQQPEEWAAFRAPVCATALDRNRLTIRVYPRKAGEASFVAVDPPGFAEVVGQVDTVSGRLSAPKVRVSLGVSGDRIRVQVAGSIGDKDAPFTLLRRVDDPRRVIGFALREVLRERGIVVPERVEAVRDCAQNLPVLVSVKSEPLAVILRRLGKDSDNFTAEMLLLAIGKKAVGVGQSDAGAKAVLDELALLGPLEAGTRLSNGSGLFDANRLSTNLFVRVLLAMQKDAMLYPEYESQLSIAATDGTLRTRLKSLKSGCFVRAKTGSLKATSSLSGYLTQPNGTHLVFAITVEGITDAMSLKPEIDTFVESLCEVPVEPASAIR